MPIARLANNTVRVLSSTLVLNDACSVVKELVDNALDAGATSILIEVSTNVVDVIQVKDNGSGIEVEDRQYLCKPYYTSKISTTNDLEQLGGQSLGFRGEALASIAKLSENVTITTRVEADVVGTASRLDSDGTMLSFSPASHPVGTTVRIENFLKQIPVRKQFALKHTDKVLAQIKKMLFHYALARPVIRVTFKVLRGKKENANWSAAPCESPRQLMSAAAKVVGSEVSAICKQRSVTSDPNDQRFYHIDAVLLDPCADIAKQGNPGQYIAIDHRPVTADRGLMKEIVSLYRQYLKSAAGLTVRVPSKPFLVLHIHCPPGSYDVNIEPAKDDVLFHEKEMVMETMHKLFSELYGELKDTDLSKDKKTNARVDRPAAPSFNLLLARKKPEMDANATLDRDHSLISDDFCDDNDHRNDTCKLASPKTGTIVQTSSPAALAPDPLRNMYDLESEDETEVPSIPSPHLSVLPISSDDEGTTNSWIKNPFTTAALHAKISPKTISPLKSDVPADIAQQTRSQPASISAIRYGSSSSPIRANNWHNNSRRSSWTPHLPTPAKSPVQHELHPSLGVTNAPLSEKENHAEITTLLSQQQESLQRLTGKDHLALLSQRTAAKRSHLRTDLQEVQQAQDRYEEGHSLLQNRGSGIDSRSRHQRTVISSVTSLPHSPIQDPHRLMPGLNHATSISNAELDEIMAFEHKKHALNQHLRAKQKAPNPADLASIQQQSLGGITSSDMSVSKMGRPDLDLTNFLDADMIAASDNASSISQKSNPYHNRYQAALRNLTDHRSANFSDLSASKLSSVCEPGQASSIAKSKAADDAVPKITKSDPRYFVITRQLEANPISGVRIERTSSARLPFETISKEHEKHDLVCLLPEKFPDLSMLEQRVKNILQAEGYVKTGKVENVAWNPFSKQVTLWQANLESCVKRSFRPRQHKNGHAGATIEVSGDVSAITIDPVRTPDVKLEISLVRAIKGHVQMLASHGQTPQA